MSLKQTTLSGEQTKQTHHWKQVLSPDSAKLLAHILPCMGICTSRAVIRTTFDECC